MISATFLKKVELMLRPKSDTLHALLTEDKYKWLWNIVNFVPFLRDYVMKQVYISKFRFSSILTHIYPVNPSIRINWMSPFPIIGVSDVLFHFYYAPNFREVEGAYWFGLVCLSVALSVRYALHMVKNDQRQE